MKKNNIVIVCLHQSTRLACDWRLLNEVHGRKGLKKEREGYISGELCKSMIGFSTGKSGANAMRGNIPGND